MPSASGAREWGALIYVFMVMLMPLTGSTDARAQPATALELVRTIALPDVSGRIDHLAIDPVGKRLFVAALGNDTLEVVDLGAGKRIARIEHLDEPQGVAYVAQAGRLFVANGRGAAVKVYAGDTLGQFRSIDGLDDADNARYESSAGRLYVGYGNALAVVDVKTATVIATIKLAGHPESFQLEVNGPRLFVNVPSAGQIAVVDQSKQATVGSWSLGDMRANYPMALDETHHRLFVATRRPAALLVYDTDAGKRIATVATIGDADDLFYDAQRKRIYVIGGEGAIDVVRQRDADQYERVGRVRTAPGARTGLFAADDDALYVAVPAHGAAPAEIRVYAPR